MHIAIITPVLLFSIVNPQSCEAARAAARRIWLPRHGVAAVPEAGKSAAATRSPTEILIFSIRYDVVDDLTSSQ
jgi:hypothetical protein